MQLVVQFKINHISSYIFIIFVTDSSSSYQLEKKPLFEEPYLEADDEEEEIEVEAEEDIKVVSAHDTVEGESQGMTTEESVEKAKVDSDEEAEVGSDSSDVYSRSVFVFK